VFGSSDQVKSLVSRLPAPLIQALIPIVPTYIWLGTKRQVPPQSPVAGEGLRHLDLTGAGRH
jgi:hypothetical protein